MGVFDTAEAYWTAASYSGTGSLLDLTPNGHDAQLGSTAGADTNDPTFLSHTGTNHAWFPGSDTNRIDSNADLAGNDTPTHIVYYAKVAATDWTPAAAADFIGSSSGYRTAGITATDGFVTVTLHDGSARTATSSVAPTVTDGDTLWIKIEIDNTANTVDFSTSTDTTDDYTAVSWTTLGTQQSITLGATLTSVTAFVLGGGNDTTTNDWAGEIYATVVLYDGVEVARLTPTDIAPARTALDLDGTGDYASVPDAAALDRAVDLRILVAMDDWSPSAQTWINKGAEAGSDKAYQFNISGASPGKFQFKYSSNGSTFNTATMTVANTYANGSAHWIRATYDSSSGDVNFYGSEDGAAWSKFGDTVTLTAGAINDSAEALNIGTNGANYVAGQIHQVIIKDGIDGTTVLDVDFTDQTPGAATITAETGQTVTLAGNAAIVPDGQLRIHDSTPGGSNKWDVNRATSGYVTTLVGEPMFVLDGVDDYLEVADHANLDFDASATVIIAYRTQNEGTGTLIGKRAGVTAAEAGWILTTDASGIPTWEVSDGTDEAADIGNAPAANSKRFVTGVLNRTANEAELAENGILTGTPGDATDVGDISNAVAFRVGTESDGGVPWDGEFYAAAVWRRALSDAEINFAFEALASGAVIHKIRTAGPGELLRTG